MSRSPRDPNNRQESEFLWRIVLNCVKKNLIFGGGVW